MASSQLLGPPELHSNQSTPSSSTQNPPKTLTENLSPTFESTGNPCLDFFFHIVPDTPSESVISRLELAWKHNPLLTLKLICNLRGVRGTGKSDKEGFYTSALWMHQYHPKTLSYNAKWFTEFGYLKDLPELLYRIIEGPDIREKQKKDWEDIQGSFVRRGKRGTVYWRRGKRIEIKETKKVWRKGEPVEIKKRAKPKGSMFDKQNQIASKMANLNVKPEESNKPMNLKRKRTIAKASKALQKYTNDPSYRFLHDQISNVFAELLIQDLKFLNSGESNKISLASKWCPSLDSSFDQSTLLCESIGRKVFPRESNPEYESIEEAHYAYRVRDLLRKQVLVPLRRVLEIPEVRMSSNEWKAIQYDRVPSVAMKTYKYIFFKHDSERFSEYLSSVRRGEKKIAAGALLPHEILDSLDDNDYGYGYGYGYDYSSGDEEKKKKKDEMKEAEWEVAELQWRRMVEDMAKRGKFNNCIAISDVSASMNGIPMKVSVALGLLTSELSKEPWKGKLITFSENPEMHIIEGESLKEKKRFVEQMDWGGNTDFQKVFDKILQVASDGKLKVEDMIKRVFVFSDMEFDQASENEWETDYEAIQRKFVAKGYGEVVPEIVFWNLRDSKATPVAGTQKGVALVSGYSKNLMTLFLEGGGIVDPEVVMEQALAGKEYEKLVVYD